MQQTMEQRRAAHAWRKAQEGVQQHGKDYVNDAKGLPALIMNSGLMQVMAFLEGKGGRHETLAAHLRDWLHQVQGTPVGFEPFMQHLLKAEPREFQAITAESFAWLRWLRQMAPAVKREVPEMPIAAIPEYIGQQDLSEASPGMRFSMYLPIWTERADQEMQIRKMAGAKSLQGRELAQILKQQGMDAAIAHAKWERGRFPALWHKNDQGTQSAWKRVSGLSGGDKARMQALVARQQALASNACAGDEVMVVDGEAVAPFTTGLGNEHPLENGFAFLWPYGLPYLPGSGVKGVLRQAARELAGVGAAEWDMESDWTETAIDALFGKQDSNDARRGALSFWDVIPGIEGDKLMVEVMTGHQSHYYMQGNSPHESGQPIPVYFLTVPLGSRFTFHVVCDRPFLCRIAPELAENDRWRRMLQQAFEHAFDWLGFGAKTAVGYGAMRFDEAATREREEQARQREFAQLSPEEQTLEALRKTFEEEQHKGLLSAGCQTAQKRLELLKAAQAWETPAHRRRAARLIRQTLKALPWSKKQKKQGIADELAKLEAE